MGVICIKIGLFSPIFFVNNPLTIIKIGEIFLI